MVKEGFKDELHTNVEIKFNWRDRIRILFGRTAHCDVRTQTENLPGRCESTTRAWVEPIYQRPLPPLAQAENRSAHQRTNCVGDPINIAEPFSVPKSERNPEDET